MKYQSPSRKRLNVGAKRINVEAKIPNVGAKRLNLRAKRCNVGVMKWEGVLRKYPLPLGKYLHLIRFQ
jgi:hypothetical protein